MKCVLIILFLCAPIMGATTRPIDRAPPLVVMNELEALYEPVPFDHQSHAKMSEMWDGCETCHHRKPNPATRPVDLPATRTQSDAAAIPKCSHCHEASAEGVDLRRPSLKAAYHRQCLNCHREWT